MLTSCVMIGMEFISMEGDIAHFKKRTNYNILLYMLLFL